MSAQGLVVHAFPEERGTATLCRREPGEGDHTTGHGGEWTCRACIRMHRLLMQVQAEAERFRRIDDARALVEAVAPGKAVFSLDDGEAKRCLVVLRAVLAARGGA